MNSCGSWGQDSDSGKYRPVPQKRRKNFAPFRLYKSVTNLRVNKIHLSSSERDRGAKIDDWDESHLASCSDARAPFDLASSPGGVLDGLGVRG
jgi:hypothetical protein